MHGNGQAGRNSSDVRENASERNAAVHLSAALGAGPMRALVFFRLGGTKVKCSVDPWRSSQWSGFVATGTAPLSHSQFDQKVHTLSGACFQPRSLVSTQEPGFNPGAWFLPKSLVSNQEPGFISFNANGLQN